MWVIFIAATVFCGITAITIIKIGHKVFLSMRRDEEKFNAEQEVYEKIKKNIKEE